MAASTTLTRRQLAFIGSFMGDPAQFTTGTLSEFDRLFYGLYVGGVDACEPGMALRVKRQFMQLLYSAPAARQAWILDDVLNNFGGNHGPVAELADARVTFIWRWIVRLRRPAQSSMP